jgi:hypothetical protein
MLPHKLLPKGHKGQGVLELIPTLILFCLMLAMLTSVCLYLYLQNVTITVARESARFASLNAELGTASTEANGRSAVQTKTTQMVYKSIGQTVDPSNVEVSAPTGSFGERIVSVRVNLDIPNPVVVPDLSAEFNGEPGKRLFETIPLTAEASAHYEE